MVNSNRTDFIKPEIKSSGNISPFHSKFRIQQQEHKINQDESTKTDILLGCATPKSIPIGTKTIMISK